MDLSGLKWPLIIGVVLVVGWLGTSGGVNWMQGRYMASTPGVDAAQDVKSEAGLSKLGGYTQLLWKYEKSAELLEDAVNRYPQGANRYYNMYRLVANYEHLKRYQEAYDTLNLLINQQAWTIDDRVPQHDNLSLRAAKLKEVHELAG